MKREDQAARFLGKVIGSGKFPGLQYAAVSASQELFSYTGGLADVLNAVPMSPATTMMAYSMTKTFTAAAVLQLAEQGKVSLDESVLHYVPFFPYGPGVTVRHLLSQTSGLPNPIPLRWVHSVSADASFDESAALRKTMAAHPRPSFPPGRKYAYSNLSYWILGAIIENAAGESYKSWMERRVFAPLGLTAKDAGFSIVDPALHAKGYLARRSLLNLMKSALLDKELIGRNEGRWRHIRDHYLNGPSFGGLIATARAVSLFLQDQLRDVSVLMKPETKALFFAPQVTSDRKSVPMTLGWHIGRLDQVRFFDKEGGGGGYHCQMRMYPERDIGSVIMVNETSRACARIQAAVDRIFLD